MALNPVSLASDLHSKGSKLNSSFAIYAMA